MPVATAEALESIPLLGVRVHRINMDEALQAIDRFIKERTPHHVVTLDSSMCVTAQEDADLRRIILNAELVTPGSSGVLWACRRSGMPLHGRVAGVEIVERLCERSGDKGHILFFLGAAPGIAEEAADRMRARYPGCSIAGTHHGFFGPD